MEGNFESGGGSSGGSSKPGSGGIGEFNSSGELGGTNPTNSTSSNMTHLDYLKDDVDKGYYKTETEGIFNVEDVVSDAQREMEREESPEWDLMDIPGTAHEKLSELSEMSDEEIERTEQVEESKESKREQKNIPEISTEPEKDELSFEEKVIMLQAETMKLMAEGMNSRVNKKELEELMRKLQELIEETEKEKDGKKATLLTGLFGAVLILIQAGEKSYEMVEDEVKEEAKKN